MGELVAPALRVARERVLPASAELLERPAEGGEREALLLVRVVGASERADREADLFERAIARTVERLDGTAARARGLLGEVRHGVAGAELTIRMVAPHSDLADLVEVARGAGRLRPGRDELAGAAYHVAVDVMRGSLRLAVPRVRVDPPWADDWAQRIRELRENLELRGGTLTVEGAPAEVLERVGAWGRAGAPARLMAGLRAQFDPAGVLSPGRLIFGEE
jgi:FAD/FMN-containing dehydrogenase